MMQPFCAMRCKATEKEDITTEAAYNHYRYCGVNVNFPIGRRVHLHIHFYLAFNLHLLVKENISLII